MSSTRPVADLSHSSRASGAAPYSAAADLRIIYLGEHAAPLDGGSERVADGLAEPADVDFTPVFYLVMRALRRGRRGGAAAEAAHS